MKKFIAAAVLAGLATAAFAQSQIDAAVAFQAPDLNAAEANKLTTAGDQKSKKATNLDTTVKFTYTWKLDDANTLKAGAGVDLYTPFFVGNVDPYKSQWAAKVIEPFVQYQGFGADVLTSIAAYTFNPSDTVSGLSALSYYTGPFFGKSVPKDKPNPVSNYVKATYKYSFDKTLAVVGGVETDTGLYPSFFLLDIKPQASVIWTFLQVDGKLNYTFGTTDVDKADATTVQTWVEPKATVDVGSLVEVLKGLKVYTGGKLILADSASGAKLKKSRWDDGASYTFTVKDVGTFGVDSYLRVGNIGPDNVKDDTQYDLNVKVSYTLKF